MDIKVTGFFGPAGFRASTHAMTHILDGLVILNRSILKDSGLLIPPLYESGVRYEREKNPGHEEWLDAWAVFQQGWGDCDDLACWRCAELQLQGVAARIDLNVQALKPARFHVRVRLPNGRIEDPSIALGMPA